MNTVFGGRGAVAAIALFGALLHPGAARADRETGASLEPADATGPADARMYRRRRSAADRYAEAEYGSLSRTMGGGRTGMVGPVGDALSDTFLSGVTEVSRRVGCQPRDLLAVMMRESSLRPDAWNRSSNAVGLIQFLPSTLARLGWNGAPSEFRGLSAEEQLPWIERFLGVYARYGLGSAGRLYQAVFMPASLRGGAGDETVLLDAWGPNGDRYQRNRGLDLDGDGRITVGELTASILRGCRTTAWQSVEERLSAILGDSGMSSRSPRRSGRSTRAADWGDPAPRQSARLSGYSAPEDAPEEVRGQRSESAPDLRSADGLADALSALGVGGVGRISLRSAVRVYQRSRGLSPDGIAGPRTRAALAADLDAAGIAYSP